MWTKLYHSIKLRQAASNANTSVLCPSYLTTTKANKNTRNFIYSKLNFKNYSNLEMFCVISLASNLNKIKKRKKIRNNLICVWFVFVSLTRNGSFLIQFYVVSYLFNHKWISVLKWTFRTQHDYNRTWKLLFNIKSLIYYSIFIHKVIIMNLLIHRYSRIKIYGWVFFLIALLI